MRARQAAATPDADAVLHAGQRLSYRELETRANRLARHLRARGISAGSLVGVALPRTPALIISLLAVWKAGAAYVPLDPEYPAERLSFMINDASLPLILVDASTQALVDAPGKVLDLDAEAATIDADSGDAVESGTTPADLAYVMYTSGSTGQPKGALITQRGLVNYLWWAIGVYQPARGGPVPVHSSISFDLTVTSLFPALLCGGVIELLPHGVGAQPLVAGLRHGPPRALVKITPAHLELLTRQLTPSEAVEAARVFVIGGENLTAEMLQFWRDVAPATRLINEYGPTETVVGCCVHEVGVGEPVTGSVPIGRPIANTTLYVLDAALQAVPVGATGELYIGGVGVARGYLNRPDLSAERFLADPFIGQASARMYKTGDLARWRPDGILEYLGRVDHQVKINGYRIELGEVEASIAAHPSVRAAVVVARELEPGNRQLVAYVVTRDGGAEGLRAALQERLPGYMVPALIMELDALPLTRNGKVDRDALPVPARPRAARATKLAAMTPARHALTRIWCGLLQLEHLDPEDDVFDLGATSLTVVAAVARIRDVFGVTLDVSTLFDVANIAAMESLLPALEASAESMGEEDDTHGLVPQRLSREHALPVSLSQRRMWVLHQLDRKGSAYNMSMAMRLSGSLDRPALDTAFRALVARHEAFRTRFARSDLEPVAVIAPDAAFAWTTLVPDGESEAEREADLLSRAARSAAEPFDLARGPVFRVMLGSASPSRHLLVITMHHVVSDAWSWNIVFRDLAVLFNAAKQGATNPLPPKIFDFVDVAARERALEQAQGLAALRDWWLPRLRGLRPLALPTRIDAGAGYSRRARSLGRRLGADWVRQIQARASELGATPFMALMAAFQIELARWCGQEDIAVLTPVANRTDAAAEEVVGSLINTLVIRTRVAPAATLQGMIADVRQASLEAFAHQGLAYDDLVALIRADEPGWNEPRVMFNMLNVPLRLPTLDGLEAELLTMDVAETPIDLQLTVDLAKDGELMLVWAADLFDDATMAARLDGLVARVALPAV